MDSTSSKMQMVNSTRRTLELVLIITYAFQDEIQNKILLVNIHQVQYKRNYFVAYIAFNVINLLLHNNEQIF